VEVEGDERHAGENEITETVAPTTA